MIKPFGTCFKMLTFFMKVVVTKLNKPENSETETKQIVNESPFKGRLAYYFDVF